MRPSQRRRQMPPPTLAQQAVKWALRAAMLWLTAQFFTKIVFPYSDHWSAARDQYTAAVIATTDGDSLCNRGNADHLRLRVELKNHFVDCDGADRVLQSWPAWTAFGRLMDDFDFCPGGTCMQFQFDTLSSLGLLFMLLTGTLTLVLICTIGIFCRNAYGSIASKYDLPVGTTPYPPTGTHKYDFNAPMHHKKAQ